MFLRPFISIGMALAALPALAQQTSSFDGPYAGGQLGWQQDRARVSATVVVPPTPPTLTPGVSAFTNRDAATGVGAGIFAGYNLPVGPNAVVGGELCLDFGGSSPDLNPFGPGGVVSPQRTLTLTARAGVRITSKALAYIRGGFANARFGLDAGGSSVNTSRDGWTLGPGVEVLVSERISARVEYRHSDFGNPGNAFRALGFNSVSDARLFRNQVLGGISFHF